MIKPYVDRVPLEDITELRASLLINNTVIPLNDFLQDYIANILFAIAKSLGDTPSDVTISINSDGLRIFTNSGEISFMGDFAKQMIENTIIRYVVSFERHLMAAEYNYHSQRKYILPLY